MSKQLACPECGKFNLQSSNTILVAVGLVLVVGGGLFSFILIGIPFLLIGIILLISVILNAIIFKTASYICKSCGYKFKTTKGVVKA